MNHAATTLTEDDPLRAKIDQLIKTNGGEPELALRAVLAELETLHHHSDLMISHGFIRHRLFAKALAAKKRDNGPMRNYCLPLKIKRDPEWFEIQDAA